MSGAAPFGYTKGGRPFAPYGLTKSGNVRKKPLGGEATVPIRGSGRYLVGRPQIRGQGGYYTDMAKAATKGWAPKVGSFVGTGLGYAAGSALAPGIGSAGGAAIGANAGKMLGGAFSRITGWGGYKVRSNSLIGAGAGVVPSFGEDSIRVRKRECIGHIDASVLFKNNSFPINPGMSDTFPWLSAIAQNYEQYRFNGLVFMFKSTTSDSIASTTNMGLGQVILATEYNSQTPPFENDLQMLGCTFSNSDKPSQDIMHAVECAPVESQMKLWNVRSGDVPSGADIRLYDVGHFQIATLGMGAAYTGMGQLWVTYDVTFVKSVMNNELGFNINTDAFALTTPTGGAPFGAAQVEGKGSNLGLTFNAPGTVVSFPPPLESGYYLFVMNFTGTTAGTAALTVAGTNCTVVTALSNAGESTKDFIYVMVVRLDARDAYLTLSAATLPTVASAGNLTCTQVNGEIYD